MYKCGSFIGIFSGRIFMKMRAPAYPLITVDPYFSIWSTNNKLYESDIKTWDSRTCFLIGKAEIDGNGYIFMGSAKDMDLPPMTQTDVTVKSFSTTYILRRRVFALRRIFSHRCCRPIWICFPVPLHI